MFFLEALELLALYFFRAPIHTTEQHLFVRVKSLVFIVLASQGKLLSFLQHVLVGRLERIDLAFYAFAILALLRSDF